MPTVIVELKPPALETDMPVAQMLLMQVCACPLGVKPVPVKVIVPP